MNKHFTDSLYYLKRAGEHATLGVRDLFDRVERRVRELTGREVEPETRSDRLRNEVATLQERAEDEAHDALRTVRSLRERRSVE